MADLTLQQYEKAIEAAGDAGDFDAVRELGAAMKLHMAPAPQQPPKPKTADEDLKEYMKGGWGTGLPKAAYDLGGRVVDATGSPAAGFATRVGVEAVPALASGFNSMGKAAGSLMKKPAEWLMASAIKPTMEQWKTGKAARAIDTMLQEGISPTQGGIDSLKGKIGQLNDEIASAIEKSTAKIDKKTVASYLQDAVNKFEKQVTPGADVKAIQTAWDEFLAHPLLQDKIPVQLAQKIKQGTYKSLGDKAYGELSGASEEAQKTLARGLKEEISKAVPGVGEANKAESELINAHTVAQRRVLMDANKNPLGLGALITQPWMVPFWLWDRSPAGKAALAQLLQQGGKPSNLTPAAVAETEVRQRLYDK